MRKEKRTGSNHAKTKFLRFCCVNKGKQKQNGKGGKSYEAFLFFTFDTFMKFLQGCVKKCEGHRVIIWENPTRS